MFLPSIRFKLHNIPTYRRKQEMKKILLLIAIFIDVTIMADSDQILGRALDKIINETIYSYESQKTIYKDNERVVKDMVYKPLEDPNYTLIKLNGVKPTSKDIKSFQKESREEKGGNSILYGFIGNNYMQTYDDGIIAKYEYITKESFMPGKDFKLQGEIIVNLEDEEIRKITLVNSEVFSVMGAKLTSVRMDFYFDNINDEELAISTIEFKLKGKVMMKEFTQSSITKNYNFKIIE